MCIGHAVGQGYVAGNVNRREVRLRPWRADDRKPLSLQTVDERPAPNDAVGVHLALLRNDQCAVSCPAGSYQFLVFHPRLCQHVVVKRVILIALQRIEPGVGLGHVGGVGDSHRTYLQGLSHIGQTRLLPFNLLRVIESG